MRDVQIANAKHEYHALMASGVTDQACAAVKWSLNLRCENNTRTFRRNTNPMLT